MDSEHRMTKLESSMTHTESALGEIKDKLNEHIEQHRVDQIETSERFNKIERELLRDKGFIGGVVFIVSCLWALVMVWFKYKT